MSWKRFSENGGWIGKIGTKRSSDCGDERMPRSDIVTVAKAAYFLMTQSVENLLSAYYVRWGGTTASPRAQKIRIKLAETTHPNPLPPPLELNEFPPLAAQ